jgi:hypothetical protein
MILVKSTKTIQQALQAGIQQIPREEIV